MFVILALGSNLDDPLGQIDRAVNLLSGILKIGKLSSVYLTEPVGYTDQPDFYNLVLTGTTDVPVYELHESTQAIEVELGRRSANIRNGPRVIDIDVLAFGELVLTSDSLTVPHPRMMNRTFVLEPLAEIDPGWRHPLTGETAAVALAKLETPSRVQRYGPLPRTGGGHEWPG